MMHKRARSRWAGSVILTLFFFINSVAVYGIETPRKGETAGRADVILIDTMKQFDDLQRPGVVFYHEKHTVAVEKKGKDCTACHLSENNRISLKFMRKTDDAPDAVMNTYHNNCVACHRETAASGEKSGPVECGTCHQKDLQAASTRQPMEFDKSLHYRHSKAQEEKCETCHHAYNETTRSLFYDKGKEGSCRYCHKEETQENRIDNRQASHLACISCHRATLAQNRDAGPVMCSGCHDPAEQALIETVENPPRLKRGQPDRVLLKASKKNDENPAPLRMNPVPFDHTAHETYNASCRVCHHADLNACTSCHSLTGTKESNHITLERAMHLTTSDASCVGCHTTAQTDARCAGCHASILKTRKRSSDECAACHMPVSADTAAADGNRDDTATAQTLLQSRTLVSETFSESEIPETVTIKGLMDQYEPVKLPHRKIIQTLTHNIKGDRLAGYFHREKGTLCQGCHHNSPASSKPPACASCHGTPFKEDQMLKPGLKAAYHRQCMDCHTIMGLEKPVATDCTGCHPKKA